MSNAARLALASAILACFSTAASAAPLSSETIADLRSKIRDPAARKQLQALLDSGVRSTNVGARPKAGLRREVLPAAEDAIAVSEEPDAITKLIQSNANKAPLDRQYSPCAGWQFLLRQDWKDVGNAAGASCPKPPDQAQGAQISFANDLAAQNRIVTVNGTAAILYNSITGDVAPPTPFAVSFGAYTTVNNLSNSASSQTKSNINTLAYGGLVNLGYSGPTIQNFIMLRGGMTEDYAKNVSASSVVLDWSPVVSSMNIHYPYHLMRFGIPLITRFDPDLVARFDSIVGKDQVLAFNGRRDSLRLGPEFALVVLPDPGYVTGALSRMSALFGYNVWYETYSRRQLSWFTSSVNYNLDEAGNFGIKGSYNTGQDELTGKSTNIYTIGLSGKI
jgi:hypothetical protein